MPSAAADTAGLLPGDHIVSIDGQAMRSSAHVQQLIEGLADGETIHVQVKRASSHLHCRQTQELTTMATSTTTAAATTAAAFHHQDKNTPLQPALDSANKQAAVLPPPKQSGYHTSVPEIDSILSIAMRVPHLDSTTILAYETAHEERITSQQRQASKKLWFQWWKS